MQESARHLQGRVVCIDGFGQMLNRRLERQMGAAGIAGRGYGRSPVRSSWSITPSAYTSAAVVIDAPAICSGAA
jgi:hypothetical protein